MVLNSYESIMTEAERPDFAEQSLGKCLNQPNTWANSGARKILFSTQFDQRLPLLYPEVPLVSTGYENQFGEYSSSYKIAKSEYTVLKKIKKFSFINDHYYLIIKNTKTNEIDVIERISYNHNTESYGYFNDCSYLDSLTEGDGIIPEGAVYMKSTGFDEYGNRQDGVNLLTVYMATDKTKEDGITISESAAKKLVSPLIKKVTITINDNDIPLNIFGNDQVYKSIPDVGETSSGLLCAIRREQKDESLYTQSFHMLKHPLKSDISYTVSGKVADINIYCNNPEKLKSSVYCSQLTMYYNESMRFASELTRYVEGYTKIGYQFSYELSKLYSNCKDIIDGKMFIRDGRQFSNMILEIILVNEYPMKVGDKLTNRYGGKGVISEILPDYKMPVLDNGKTIEVIYNQNTSVNRCNPSQQIEVSLNFQTDRLLEFIETKTFDASEFVNLYLEYIRMLSPETADYLENTLSPMSDEDMMLYLNSMAETGIMLSLKPIAEAVNMDKLAEIYKRFPFMRPYRMEVPVVSSTGEIRFVPSRRTVIAGKQYIYRLKQYAEDKFSTNSLSPTNMRGENCRSRNSKDYTERYSRTPVKIGGMESTDLGHIGTSIVIAVLMIYSVSPKARRLCSEMITGNPFDINIKLDSESSNRSVEIVNAYLKTAGYKIEFTKRFKTDRTPMVTHPMKIYPTLANSPAKPMVIYDTPLNFNYAPDKQLMALQDQHLKERENGVKRPMVIHPMSFIK